MKFSIIYTVVSLLFGAAFGIVRHNEKQPELTPATLNFQPALNVSVGPNTVLSAYPESGVDFVLDYQKGRVTIGSDEGQFTYPAEVFRLSNTEWTAQIDGGQYVTVNAETGTTDRLIDGEYRFFSPEHP